MGKCEYRYDGNIHTAGTKEACAKLKAGYQKYLKDNNMDNAKSRLKRNNSTTRGDDFQKKKNPTSKIKKKATQLITNFRNRRKVAKQRRAVQSSRRRGLDRNTKN